MKEQPLVSVIIPVYNGEKTIEKAIKSIMDQPKSRLIELVVVNDGSKDNTQFVVKQLMKVYHGIVYIEKENGGVSSARNRGIEASKGKYINFCDADDWWVDSFFDDDVLQQLAGNDIVVFSRAHVSPTCSFYNLELGKNESAYYDAKDSKRYRWEPPTCIFCKNELVKKYNLEFDAVNYFEDILFWYKAFSISKSIIHSDKLMYMYWMNPNSVQHNYDSLEQFEHAFSRFQYLARWFRENNIVYEVDRREQLSMIVSYLPHWCANYNWEKVMDIVGREPIHSLLSADDLLPWKHMKKLYFRWKRYPFLFFLSCKISPGIYNRARDAYFKAGAHNKLIEFLLYMVIKRWKRFDNIRS